MEGLCRVPGMPVTCPCANLGCGTDAVGAPCDQVRDFAFVPDDGRITALSYDTFGVPSIPEALLNVYEVWMCPPIIAAPDHAPGEEAAACMPSRSGFICHSM